MTTFELWFFVRESPIAIVLNPSLKSRFVSEFSGFSRIKKSWPPENKKRPKNKKIKNAIFIEKIKHVKNVFTSMPIVFQLDATVDGALVASEINRAKQQYKQRQGAANLFLNSTAGILSVSQLSTPFVEVYTHIDSVHIVRI